MQWFWQLLIDEKNKVGQKDVKNAAVLYTLAFDNFNFT